MPEPTTVTLQRVTKNTAVFSGGPITALYMKLDALPDPPPERLVIEVK